MYEYHLPGSRLRKKGKGYIDKKKDVRNDE